ncbi:lipid II:glycine glycyltransferase FemX [Pedosphaera parvula]|uniref:BioF2-like acetyltransferase domain-containing protein n=1 Tax=Pedosphaera parvula (strain Ellin514) TaxID=320771 RepID=B9XD18_PEDPL|nr:GNAT family N-acetyltransferase [Pedosphaera parvula]EEF62364.1 conserved hypothetical protein [Pedosphaera parvula Ellin514]
MKLIEHPLPAILQKADSTEFVPTQQAADFRVQTIDPVRNKNWEDQAGHFPAYSLFHSAAWARVLQKTYAFTPTYFVKGEGKVPEAMLPVMEVNSWLTGRRGISLPFTDDCTSLGLNSESVRHLFWEAVRFGKERNWKYLECRGGREWLPEACASLSFYGHILELKPDEELMFAALDPSVRRAIRKGRKDGIRVEVSDSLEAVRLFYALLCKTRRKHGLPPQPFKFFENIYDEIISKQMGKVVTAMYGQKPIAAGVYFQANEKGIYKYGASDEAFQHLRGNNLVMWEAIKWHLQHGFKSLHMGRTSIGNEGLRKFKLGWGCEEHQVEYIKYDLRKQKFVQDKDEAFGWHNTLFRCMPGFLSKVAGALLYKHVA